MIVKHVLPEVVPELPELSQTWLSSVGSILPVEGSIRALVICDKKNLLHSPLCCIRTCSSLSQASLSMTHGLEYVLLSVPHTGL